MNREVTINGNGNIITVGGDVSSAAVASNNVALGLHIGTGANVTIENAIIEGTGFADNIIEVMGNDAKLTLKDIEIKGSKQAAIYVGDSASNGTENLTLEGNITFIENAWGGVGVKNGATVDATNASFEGYTTTTQEYFYELNESAQYVVTQEEVTNIIWDDSKGQSTVNTPSSLEKNFIYKNGVNKVKTTEDATDEKAFTQILWTLK